MAPVEAKLPEAKEQECQPWTLWDFLSQRLRDLASSRDFAMANGCRTLYQVAAGAVCNSDPGCKGLAFDLVSHKLFAGHYDSHSMCNVAAMRALSSSVLDLEVLSPLMKYRKVRAMHRCLDQGHLFASLLAAVLSPSGGVPGMKALQSPTCPPSTTAGHATGHAGATLDSVRLFREQ